MPNVTDMAVLDGNYDRILTLEQTTSTARAAVHEATVNILQSRHEISTSGAMLSAATRAAMGKRGLAQLEQVKGLLDVVADTAALVRNDASALRDEVRDLLKARDAALAAKAEAETSLAETTERVEAEGAAAVVATNEVASRAQQEAASASARAEAAELRAEQAERGFKESERQRALAASTVEEATSTREVAVTRLQTVEAQLERERSVMARVMAENILFVKKLEFAEGEKQKALEEKEALRSEWRQQAEGWFATAAEEMQSRLLADWGAADTLQAELQSSKRDAQRTGAALNARVADLSATEHALQDEVTGLSAEAHSLQAERDELQARLDQTRNQLKAAQVAGQQLVAQVEVRQQQLEEAKGAEVEFRQRSEAILVERLTLKAGKERAEAEAEGLRSALQQSEGREKLTSRVNERIRGEASEEHTRLLEALAKLDALQEQYDLLTRQNSVLIRTAETAVGA